MIAEKIENAYEAGKINIGRAVEMAWDFSHTQQIDNDKCTQDYYTFPDTSILCIDWQANKVYMV